MKKFRFSPLVWVAFLLVVVVFVFLLINPFRKEGEENAPQGGAALAKQYCASCHVFPEPRLLDKKTWSDGVLPNMGMRLGIRNPGKDPYEGLDSVEAKLVRGLNVFPRQQLIQGQDWQQIVDYYVAQAPEAPLPQNPKPTVTEGLPLFQAKPIYIGEKQTPYTSLLKYDARTSQLYVGDGKNQLYIFKKDLSLASNWFMPSPPVDIDFPKVGSPRLLCIGSMAPTQQRNGNFFTFDASETPSAGAFRFDSLARPVSVATGDLNGDNQEDAIICSFGNYTGKLSWYESFDQKKEHILLDQPGSRKAVIADMNHDGLPDIVVLMAQGREELVMFQNLGEGKFEQKILQQFPSVYGVSYFELADFNKDGHPDILVTNGDNWDLSPIKKYYHGIRIFMNDGKNNFKESYFFPSYGAAKAMARDFDLDGDLDIAAISFSDDLDKTEHGFVYLENKGGLNFSAASTPAAANGKWMTMEVADIDKDGDEDIVIGSFLYNLGEMTRMIGKGIENFPNIVVFWNKRK